MTCVALENTDSISTNSTGSVGTSGWITRLTRKCFCFFTGVTAVHLLKNSFLGFRGFIRTWSLYKDWEGCNLRLQASSYKVAWFKAGSALSGRFDFLAQLDHRHGVVAAPVVPGNCIEIFCSCNVAGWFAPIL